MLDETKAIWSHQIKKESKRKNHKKSWRKKQRKKENESRMMVTLRQVFVIPWMLLVSFKLLQLWAHKCHLTSAFRMFLKVDHSKSRPFDNWVLF